MPITPASKSPYREIETISTGLPQLDRILGGGIPFRRITEISGPFGMGKTTLALTTIREAQKGKRKTLFVDIEHSFDERLALICGVDLDRLDLLQPETAEEALDETEEYLSKNKSCVVVLDSIGALLPRAEKEKMAGEKSIGGQAGLVAKFCRKVVPVLSLRNSALIVLNHEFTDIMSGRLMTSGGAKLAYHKAVWIRLRQKQGVAIKSGEQVVGKVILAEIKKNKMAATENQSCDLQLIYGKGFNAESDLIETAKEKLFEKRGQFFYWGDLKVARGEKGLREAFEDVSFLSKVKDALA